MKIRILVVLFSSLFLSVVARAAVPPQFTVQGVIRDDVGRLQSLLADITVTFYDAPSAGNRVAGPFGPMRVPAVNGLFTAVVDAPNLKQDLAAAGPAGVWMEIVEGSTIFARQPLTSEIYAIAAGSADQADGLSDACTGCVVDSMIDGVAANKVNGKVAAAFAADSVTNGLYSSMSYVDPAWLTSLDGAKITGKVGAAFVADSVFGGVYVTGSYADPAFITSLGGAKITGPVASAMNADTVTNGVYTSGAYFDPAWITGLAGAKVVGAVSDSSALGGIPAASYQQALKSGCQVGSYIQSVSADGNVTCGPGAASAFGASGAGALTPDMNGSVAHLVMDAPADGFVTVTASYQVAVDNTQNGAPASCSTSNQLAAAAGVPSAGAGFQRFQFPGNVATRDGNGNLVTMAGSATVRLGVRQGRVTIYLNGASDCSHAQWSNVTISATYQPQNDATFAFVTP